MFASLFQLMGMMLLLMLSGFLMRRTQIITAAGKKSLTDIILYAVLPCNIIKAFSAELENDFMQKFLQVLIAAICVQLLYIVLANLLYSRMEDGEKRVFQYATICSNAGFMGNPMAEGVFGETGLLYAAVFLIPQRITMWTAGASCFQKGSKREIYRKVLTHPCMIATYIGLVIMIFHLRLPGVISRTVLSFSSCCTALTMVYIGTILTEVDLKTVFSMKQVYFAAVRLLLIPLAVFAGCRLAGVDPVGGGVCTLLSAMPAGSTVSLLAAKYSADEQAAARCVVFTTALSCITIPIWSLFLLSFI